MIQYSQTKLKKRLGGINMDFNKCSRCGNFYLSNDDLCPKCKTKDMLEYETFKTYISENGFNNNLDYLSEKTGMGCRRKKAVGNRRRNFEAGRGAY